MVSVARTLPRKPDIGPELSKPNSTRRISLLLWGEPGTGKTTLAATAPGRKLIFLFDPDGESSLVGGPDDVQIRKVFEEKDSIVPNFRTDNPLGITDYFADFDTFIFDSLTNITDKTLSFGVSKSTSAPTGMPQTAAYGARNVHALALVKNVLAATSKAGKHVIFTAHQAAQDISQGDSLVRHTSIALGGKLPAQIGPSFSEIWCLRTSDSAVNRGGRVIMTRSHGRYTPIKTRMWEQKDTEFIWGFDAEDWNKEDNGIHRLSTWYEVWNHYNRKLPHPGSKEFKQLIEGMK